MFVRRYLRFSLKASFCVMTALALLIGFTAHQAHRQESAVDALVEAGGSFTYDRDIPVHPPWLHRHLGMHYFVKPVMLSIGQRGEITPTTMERLTDLPHLEKLALHQKSLSDELMSHLPLMDNLRWLWIEPSTIESENRNLQDFSFLLRLPQLRELHLPFSSFRDSDATYLSKTTELESLNLSYTDFEDTGLQKIHLDGLVRLNLAGTRITDKSLRYLSSLPKLKYLDLNGTRISDEGLANLRSLPQLHSLALVNTPITDGAAEHLACIASLTRLRLVSTNVSEAGINTIHEALPNCRIQVDWNQWVK